MKDEATIDRPIAFCSISSRLLNLTLSVKILMWFELMVVQIQ